MKNILTCGRNKREGPLNEMHLGKKLSLEMIGTRNDVTNSFLAKNLQGCGKWCNFVTTK